MAEINENIAKFIRQRNIIKLQVKRMDTYTKKNFKKTMEGTFILLIFVMIILFLFFFNIILILILSSLILVSILIFHLKNRKKHPRDLKYYKKYNNKDYKEKIPPTDDKQPLLINRGFGGFR